jgi:hypothetical protein
MTKYRREYRNTTTPSLFISDEEQSDNRLINLDGLSAEERENEIASIDAILENIDTMSIDEAWEAVNNR